MTPLLLCIQLTLQLAAPPPSPVVLEPDPGEARRLHPRRVTASSFLRNGWNSQEQNYLPPYVADDDASTAWVEGAKGRGEGESLLWLGPTLEQGRRYTVFLRNGYQKSQALYRAKARPKSVRLEPVQLSEAGPVAAGAAVEVTLADTLGWQEVKVPTEPKATGLRLTVLSTYPGTSYEDTCLSDLRVYVEAGDAYRADLEALAFEEVRTFAAERRRAARMQGSKARVVLAPRYSGKVLTRLEPEKGLRDISPSAALRRLSGDRALGGALERAWAAAETFARVDRNQSGHRNDPWQRVKAAAVHPASGTAKVSLAELSDEGLAAMVSLLHLGDAAFFEADTEQKAVRARIAKLQRQEARALAACVKECKSERAASPPDPSWECGTCEDECSGTCWEGASFVTASMRTKHEMEAGDFILGTVERPSALLRAVSEVSGDRDAVPLYRQSLVLYEGDLAGVVVSARNWGYAEGGLAELDAHVLDWETLPDGRSQLKGFTTFTVSYRENKVTVRRFTAA